LPETCLFLYDGVDLNSVFLFGKDLSV